MDGDRFDALTKGLTTRANRRAVLRGLAGLAGGGTLALLGRRNAGAQWSVQICMPNSSGGYTLRLVPKSSVPFYQRQYGAVLPTDGVCPPPSRQPDLSITGGLSSADGVISGTGFTPGATIEVLEARYYGADNDPIVDEPIDYQGWVTGVVDSDGWFTTSPEILFCVESYAASVDIQATDSAGVSYSETFYISCGDA
jgi:hypothetical protein